MPKTKNTPITVELVKTHVKIADQCHVAVSYMDRLRGLIGRQSLPVGEGVLFPRCNSIHMWFMSIPIDVVFLDKSIQDGNRSIWRVTSVHESVRPWKALPLNDWAAADVLELPVGTIRRHSIYPGDEICSS